MSTTTLHWSNADAEVHKVVVGPYENNVFVIRCKQTGDAVLIDAANEHERLLELCQRLGVRRVLETHGHWDHIQAVPAIDRLTDEAVLRMDLEDAVRLAWDHLHVVPVDQRCLDRAAGLAREQPVRLTSAIHLAAAERMPAPVRFVTFDPGQLGVALGLGLDVVSS